MVWKGVDLSKEMNMLFPKSGKFGDGLRSTISGIIRLQFMFKIIAVTDSFGHFA